MIELLSSWAKGIGVTIVIVSIFEMLLPNNNTKKYIRMVLGVYILFNIIAPVVKNKEIFNFDNFDLQTGQIKETSVVDQTSMNERIEELYEQEMVKDITKKLKEKGFEVTSARVYTQIGDSENETKINKIKLKIEKSDKKMETEEKQNTVENKIVTEVQKIKKVDTAIETNKNEENKRNSVTKEELQSIKKFLIEEYGVSEKCLEIN